jgi:Leucine-rich repeat (LRR) protein
MGRENKAKVRWKTISLRGLLLLILAIALWLGWIVNKARQQRQAVAALQEFGGFVHYDWEFVDGPVKVPRGNWIWKPSWGTLTPGRKPWAPDWMRRAVGDEYFQSIVHVSLYVDIKKGLADSTWVNKGTADDALRKLTTQKQVRTLQIGGNQVTDLNLAYVGQMTGLEELNISWGFHLTDKGFLHLSGLRRLRILDIDNSKMTDASLEAIGKLTNLEELRIGGEGFSDRGVGHLKGLTRLRYLSLGEGKHEISDAGLDFLENMRDLEYIDLRGWNVSDGGIAKLRELKKLKTVKIGLSEDDDDRRRSLQEMLPGVSVE